MRNSVILSSILLSACASTGATHYALPASTVSRLEMIAPGLAGCKAIKTKYNDLSLAPPEVLKDVNDVAPGQKVVSVWVMDGCQNDIKKKINAVSDGNGGGLLLARFYQ